MLGFLIKKAFFDMWDNLLPVVLMNLGFILLTGGLFLAPYVLFLPLPGVWQFVYLAGGAILLNFYLVGVCRYALEISDGRKAGFSAFFQFIARSWKQSLISSLVTIILLAASFYAIPYYLTADSVVFLAAGALVFWTWFTVFFALIFFAPLSFRLKKKPLANLRLSFFFLFDNTPFCVFSLLISVVILALSVVTFLLLPGMATILLWLNVAVKIRLYKYDYLEAHPGANRKKIPWDKLIEEDEKAMGKRTLRGMIFPWKD